VARYWIPLFIGLHASQTVASAWAQSTGPISSVGQGSRQKTWSLKSLQRLDVWAQSHGASVSAAAVDLSDGKSAHLNGDVPLNPASNAKLVTAAFALDKLGPSFTFRTAIFGSVTAEGNVPKLVLRGEGDPSLTEADIWRLANTLRNRGVRQIQLLLVDQTAFDAQVLPPAFEQQPGEWASFRAPVSAISVDRNAVTLNVLPRAEDSPAHAWFEPGGVVKVTGEVQTRAAGSGQNIHLKLSPSSDGTLHATLGGHVAVGLGRQRFPKRVDNPQLLPGYVLANALADLGIRVERIEAGVVRDLPLISYISSAPLSQLLLPVGKQSDNFTAEMLFKSLSASSNGVASFAGSSALVETWLRQRFAAPIGTRLVNGSGLFDANRLSAALLLAVLADAYADPRRRDAMLSHLSVGGQDGTLAKRFNSRELSGRIRAKTGTLNGAIALSGYVLREGPTAPIAFSVLLNAVEGKHYEARELCDALVAELAGAAPSPQDAPR
jgi:D-alanyl-D-alanine carboxypeptidase/D-alanyl-D-alanine-endopeptidase (penicillin-binding protein 4)